MKGLQFLACLMLAASGVSLAQGESRRRRRRKATRSRTPPSAPTRPRHGDAQRFVVDGGPGQQSQPSSRTARK